METLTNKTEQINTLIITPTAKQRISELLSTASEPNLDLRIYISKMGGCSGFEYGFAFDQAEEDDLIVHADNIKIIIDPISFSYLKGATLDYMETTDGSNFMIKNAVSRSCCGCGENSCC